MSDQESTTAMIAPVEPEDLYDVAAWDAYYAANPRVMRSLGAAAADNLVAPPTDPVDPPADPVDPPADLVEPVDPPVSAFGDGWREELAGDDTKILKRLGRFNDVPGLFKSYQALEQKMNTPEAKGQLPENYTDEELAAYRETNGVPEKVEGYFDNLPDGLVIGDEDKERLNSFAEAMHDMNLKPDVVHTAAAWYYAEEEKTQAAQAEADETHRASTEDVLRTEWGNEYRSNINTLNAYLDGAPEGVSEVILNARGADGQAIMNNPGVLKFLSDKARAENPYVTITPQGGDNTTIADEKKQLEKEMGMGGKGPYWSDKAKQDRYAQIMEWEEKNEETNRLNV